MEPIDVKYNNLLVHIKSFKKLAIAFSGGVDSSLLLYLSKAALNDKVLALTVSTPYIPRWEIEEAEAFTQKHGIQHKIVEFPLLNQLKENPKDRCYICKKHLFEFLLKEADKEGYSQLADGTNFDDTSDYRPGMKALKELSIISPFLETRVTKNEIRRWSKHFDLPTWEKPAYACLLTRIPYGQEIKNGELRKIEEAEKFLFSLGFEGSRVRIHGNLARIEILRNDFDRILNTKLFNRVSTKFKEIGFAYVTLDLDGYRMGSHNLSD